MNKKICFYHGSDCSDGFGAAYVFYKKFGQANKFVPINYSNVELCDVSGADVYCLDLCFSENILNEIKNKSNSLTILDHHLSNKDVILKFGFNYDATRSGVGLAWDYFFNTERPWWVNYIEDRDLWNWKLPFSEEISAAIEIYEKTFNSWDNLTSLKLEDVQNQGKIILSYKNRQIKEIIRKAYTINILEYNNIPICNSSIFKSEIGSLLCQDSQFCIIWSKTDNNTIHLSLRSNRDNPNSVDVSNIAKILDPKNGGGHKNAAGATIRKIEQAELFNLF